MRLTDEEKELIRKYREPTEEELRKKMEKLFACIQRIRPKKPPKLRLLKGGRYYD